RASVDRSTRPRLRHRHRRPAGAGRARTRAHAAAAAAGPVALGAGPALDAAPHAAAAVARRRRFALWRGRVPATVLAPSRGAPLVRPGARAVLRGLRALRGVRRPLPLDRARLAA